MFCSKCGNSIKPGSLFCDKCGNQINVNKSETTVSSTHLEESNVRPTGGGNNFNNNNKIVIIVVAIVVLVVALLIGSFAVRQAKLKKVDDQLKEDASHINDIFDDEYNTSSEKTNKTASYGVGDAVTLKDESKWHVMSISGNNVTLLSDVLVKDESGYGSSREESSQKYENSIVKQYLEETYIPILINNLETNGGDTTNLNVRLITTDEFLNLGGYKWLGSDYELSTTSFDATDIQISNRSWLGMTNSYWTMSNIKEYDSSSQQYGAYFILVDGESITISGDWIGKESTIENDFIKGTHLGIRPVIETTINNLK